MQIQLPNGIRQKNGTWVKDVVLSEMTGEEEDILADSTKSHGRKKGDPAMSASKKFTKILSRCTVSIGDDKRPEGKSRKELPGFFEDQWDEAFITDRGFALVRLRQLSLGDQFEIKGTPCPYCDHPVSATLDLAELECSSLDISELQETGGIFSTSLPSGDEVVWRFATGKDESAIINIKERRKEDLFTGILFHKILKFNNDKPVFEVIKGLPIRSRNYLREQMDSKEGGLDNTAEIECPKCEREFSCNIQFGSVDFFFPSATSSSSNRKSSY